jgi:hypothetical protein
MIANKKNDENVAKEEFKMPRDRRFVQR